MDAPLRSRCRTFLSPQKVPGGLLEPVPALQPQILAPTDLISLPMVLPFPECRLRGITLYCSTVFGSGCFPLAGAFEVHPWQLHISVVCSFLLLGDFLRVFINSPPVDGYLYCFPCLVIKK